MTVYVCPVCQQRTVAYVARFAVLACHLSACRKWFHPPRDPDLLACVLRADVSPDDANKLQAWLSAQNPAGPPPGNSRPAARPLAG